MSQLPSLSSLDYISKVSEQARGKAVMVECFATWCPPCRRMIPHLAQMTKKYPNVFIVSISSEDRATVAKFAARMPVMRQYNLAAGSTIGQQLMSAKGVRGIPHAFFFDKEGRMVWDGHPSDDECEALLVKYNGAGTTYFSGKGHQL
eukprot:gnl/Dysnectes_brevis/2600_a3140_1847.p1 GENE.gnl/Dysnectes_brevis/2600_a3140_1847~~gnl/Dysnectes_brevis/2600_a3140_1847.p1  ORF type:complete len:147 (-),score=27.77 gnl/Dysnectes_brevis/2600_a3140_1847:38-478(-)